LKLLLDTHVLVWWLLDDPALPKRVTAALRDPASEIFVSSASAWEIATKYRLGRMPQAEPLVQGFRRLIDDERWVAIPVTVEHALVAGTLRGDNRDPFDRMLAAQAQLEDMKLVTADRALAALVPSSLW
jgi:PIN domain nuclease of toxin-antitoxin system